MSLSALINAADCGPVNPLQGLSKQLDRDRGAQQDHFGSTSRAGPSRPTFRTQPPNPSQSALLAQEANQFFSNAQPFAQPAAPAPFDLSSLRIALPNVNPAQMQTSNQHLNLVPVSTSPAWTMEFDHANASQSHRQHTQGRMVLPIAANKDPSMRTGPPLVWGTDFSKFVEMAPPNAWPKGPDVVVARAANGNSAWIDKQIYNDMQRDPVAMQSMITWIENQNQKGIISPNWAAQFASIEEEALPAPISAPSQIRHQPQQQQQSQSQSATITNPDVITVDDLSATAGLLIDSVQHDGNPKFQNSEFMGLMKRLRDRKVVVEGNDMVDSDTRTSYAGSSGWADEFSSSMSTNADGVMDKGKGRVVGDVDIGEQIRSAQFSPSARYLAYLGNAGSETDVMSESELEVHSRQEVNEIDPYYRQHPGFGVLGQVDEEDEPAVLGKDYLRDPSSNSAYLAAEWGRLQADWDHFEATTTGIVPVGSQQYEAQIASSPYTFQRNNPYMRTDEDAMRIVMHERSSSQSVLEAEAEVQRDLTNASAWFVLGVKQQENECEDKAIHALEKAVSLNPTYLEAWLALAVSHTNENNREASLGAIRAWVNANKPYAEAVKAHEMLNAESIALARMGGTAEKQKELVECLMTMARMTPHEGVDADIQIALGVLLNMSEEYEKARDCFQTALAVRPGDWLLYNRVGATLANSGHAAEALDYYYRALELSPTYIRARFNLGISYINLRLFEDAARHVLDALVLQENDAFRDEDGSGLSNSTLWDTLKSTCLYLQRHDLVALCEAKDLGAFRSQFYATGAPSQGNGFSGSGIYDYPTD